MDLDQETLKPKKTFPIRLSITLRIPTSHICFYTSKFSEECFIINLISLENYGMKPMRPINDNQYYDNMYPKLGHVLDGKLITLYFL